MAIKKKQNGGFAPTPPQTPKIKKNLPEKNPNLPKIDPNKTSKPGKYVPDKKNPNLPNLQPPKRKY